MIRGRLAAAAALCIAAAAALAAPGGDVRVSGSRLLRDGRPWVAEGTTPVGRGSPEGEPGRSLDKGGLPSTRAADGSHAPFDRPALVPR